jgi:hypothetical protein
MASNTALSLAYTTTRSSSSEMSINEKDVDTKEMDTKFIEDTEQGIQIQPVGEVKITYDIQDAVFGNITPGGPNYRSLGW